MVTKKSLEKFVKKGGYEVVRFDGKVWRGMAEAVRTTGLDKRTIKGLMKEYPEPPKEIRGRRVWVTPEQDRQFEKVVNQMSIVSRKLKTVQKYFEDSLIVDLMELRARKELQDWTDEQFQESFVKQVEADNKEQGNMEKLFNEILEEFESALNSLNKVNAELRYS